MAATKQRFRHGYKATWQADNCGDVTVTNDYTAIPTTCVAGSNTVTVTFTVTDACNRTSTDQAVITMTDNVKPVIMTSPQDLIVECTDANRATLIANWTAAFGGATAIDNCDDSVTLSFVAGTAIDQCGNTSTTPYTLTATDDCGNFVTRYANLIITDETAPVFNAPTATNTVVCSGTVSATKQTWLNSATGTDACGG
jgi:hypothetical protein